MNLDLDTYRALGPQPDEFLLPNDDSDNKPKVDQESLNQLLQMGFPEPRCIKALSKNNNNLEAAMNWLFEHMDDADIDIPDTNTDEYEGKEGEISMLMDMGFTRSQAIGGLRACDGNVERAVDYLFSHPEVDDSTGTAGSTSGPVEEVEEVDGKPAKYALKAFISHRGTSTHAGHYVSHIKKEDKWVLFNDEKVVLVPESEIENAAGEGYIYFYERQH
jgi:ubiquitin carboxyl-terminal hydrolase 5/13